MGRPPGVPNIRYTQAEIAAITKAWRIDPHPERVATTLGISVYRVRKAVKDYGLRSFRAEPKASIPQRQRHVLTLYEAHGTMERVAKTLGISTTAVHQTIKRIQHQMRKRYNVLSASGIIDEKLFDRAQSDLAAEDFTPRMISIALGLYDLASQDAAKDN
jgi:predicted DNA-binding protein YlxM (UPF0122 family)